MKQHTTGVRCLRGEATSLVYYHPEYDVIAVWDMEMRILECYDASFGYWWFPDALDRFILIGEL